MVNKGIIVVGIIVLLSAVGVGALIGMQVGGGGPAPVADGGTDETPTGNDGDAPAETETPTQQDEPAATETETERTPISPRQFNDGNMTEYIEQFINEERQSAGLDPLQLTGPTAKQLDDLAVDHSNGMAAEGRVIHTIDNESSADRYKNYGLYDACVFKSTEGSYLVRADNPEQNQFEAIGMAVAGQTYEVDGEQRFLDSDRAVAQAIVDDWMASNIYRDRLMLPGTERLGVGVTITNTGNVYATANVCG
ncbi:CAP domain-containing protein [Halomicroarcula sp. GCM10025324]|uniref:CAP domain-containing protein n=1 Tax=Haloarcula TaxID=2237 RepID=UPI0023E845F2|nr:CAP domain-containing protein [Halomicroarcula sp. ZS-22-S1]